MNLANMKIERFDEIKAWQLARELTRKIYKLTNKDEFAQDYGLATNSKRCWFGRA